MFIKEMFYECMDWIRLIQDSEQWRAVVNMCQYQLLKKKSASWSLLNGTVFSLLKKWHLVIRDVPGKSERISCSRCCKAKAVACVLLTITS